MINKKAQAVLICLWILIALSVMSVGIGHRVSLGLRLSSFQRDTLKAQYLAKAALDKAIIMIKANTQQYNCLRDDWANNPDAFKDITLSDNADGHAYVGYLVDGGTSGDIIYGAIDEQRKININLCDHSIIVSLLQVCGIDQTKAEELATNIEIWRGTKALPDDQDSYYRNTLGYACKKNKLTNIDELVLISGFSGIDNAVIQRIKNLITVYGDEKINPNTASEAVLKVLALKAVGDISGASESDASNFVLAIITMRQNADYFSTANINDMIAKLSFEDAASDNRTKILSILQPIFTVKSSFYRITSSASVHSANVNLTVIYDKNSDRVVWYHKN